jgi:hypothetical protein
MLRKLSTWSSPDQNAGQNHNIKIDNKSFETLEQLTYLGTTITYQNLIQEYTGAD